MEVLVDTKHLRHVAERGEIHGTLPIVCGHEVQKHDGILVEVVVLDFPSDFVHDLVFHALGHDAVAKASLFVDGKFHITAGHIVVGITHVTLHRFGVVEEVDDLFQLDILALEIVFFLNRHGFVDAIIVFLLGQGERKLLGLIYLAAHLVDIPVTARKHVVAHAHIGAEAFDLLNIPQGEGVVVATGEDDRIGR